MKNGFKNKQASFKQKAFKPCIALLLGILSSFFAEAQVSLTATSGTATGSFTTISDAFTAINTGTHKGVINISITANTTEPATPVPLLASGTGSSSYTRILIRPSGGNFTINSNSAPSTNRGIIELSGADNVTIDGDDPLTAGTNNLTIQSVTSTTAGIACIRLSSNSTTGTDGANNDSVLNCNIIGARSSATVTTISYGIQFSNGTSTSSSTGGAYSSLNTVIMNNNISRVYYGINAIGVSATYPNTGLRIIKNTIGSATSTDNIGLKGIIVTFTATAAGSTSAIVSDNDVRVGDYGTTGYSASISGIELGSTNAGCLVTRNNIHDINQPSTGGYGAYGMLINNATNNSGITITNNFIRDCKMYVYSTSIPSSFMPIGVYISAGATNIIFNHNTIVMNDQLAVSTVYTSACIIATSSVTFTQVLNNILINNHASSGAYCFYTASTANISSATVNNNNYFATSIGNIGYYSAANQGTFSAWKSATAKDANSISESTTFVSSTDLHIPAGSYSFLESGGASTAITGVSVDIDNQTRPGTSTYGYGTAPDIGADEFNGRVGYTCSTPAPGATIKSPSAICFGNSLSLSLTTATLGTGVSYQWQSASSASGPWVDIVGQTAATATVTPSAYEFYRCKVKCLAGPDSTNSTPVQVAYTNSIVSTTGGSVCGSGTVSLSAMASTGGTLKWYAAASSGSALGTGSPFITPSISATTDFYVANEVISTTSVTNGTGTVSSSGSGSSPFSQFWESNRSQYLVLASELSALGLVAGNISAMSIPVSSKVSSKTFTGYTIKFGHTTVSAMTAGSYLAPTFTTVYGPTDYTSVSGANNFSFSSSFNWDGTSNIVIDLCFDNDPTSSGIFYSSSDAVSATTKSYMAVVGMYADNATLCGATTGGTYVNTTNLPNFSFSGNVACNSARVPVTATFNPLPSPPTVTASINYCVGSTASALSATGTGLKWYTVATGGTGSTTAPTPSTATVGTTNYYVSQTNSTTLCESPRALIAVTVNPLPSAPTVSTPINYCVGSTASALTATGINLKWYTVATGGTSSSTAPTPSTAIVGTVNYYVSQTDGLSCESPRALIAVITNSILPAPTVTTPVNICLGATTTALTATGTGLTWYTTATGGTGSSTAPIPSSAATGTTNYYVSQSASGACEGPRALIAAQVNPLPTAPTVTTPVTYCQNITATALTATGTSLKWYTVATGGTGSTTAPIPSTVAAGITSYYVSQTNTFVCEGSRALINVTVNPAPALPTITTPVVYCQNSIASALTATGTSLKWYTVATGGTGSTTAPTPSTSIATTLNYYVTQSNTTTLCESPRANLVVTVNPQPAAPTITSPIAYCQNATTATALSATGTSLLWYTTATGGTGSSTAPTPATTTVGATNNYVTQTNSFSCESPRANIVVNINPLPAAPTVSSPLNLCIGSVALPLTATGTSLQWYSLATGGTSSTAAPTPSTTTLGATDYYVSQTNTFVCEGPRAKLTVQVQPLPVVSISSLASSGFIFCRYQSITLKANAPTATNYQWSFNDSNLIGAIANTIAANTTGYYKVDVKDVYGCKNKDSVWAQRDTSVVPTLTPSNIKICKEGSELLFVNPGYASWSFNWQMGGAPLLPAMPTSNLRNVNASGVYSVITTNSFGCLDTTNNATISYHSAPIKPTISNVAPLLSISKSYNYYQWYKNNVSIVGANSSSYKVTAKGSYHVEVTDENGCLNQSDTVKILSTTGIESAIKNELKIYPNPTRNIVKIDAPIKVNVKVTDIVGKLVLEAKDTKEINLEQFADGTYLLVITDEENNMITIEKIHKIN